MSLGLATEAITTTAQTETVLAQIKCTYEPNGSIKFQATICDRITLNGKITDLNHKTVNATYPSEEIMIALAAGHWAPVPAQLKVMGEAVSSSAAGAVTVILQGFAGICNAAVATLLNPPVPEIETEEL